MSAPTWQTRYLDDRVRALEALPPAISDHGGLTGLGDDDHSQYWNDTRGNAAIDARVTKAFVNALNVDADTLDGIDSTGFSLAGHTHSYLPLSGGTLTGLLITNAAIRGDFDTSDLNAAYSANGTVMPFTSGFQPANGHAAANYWSGFTFGHRATNWKSQLAMGTSTTRAPYVRVYNGASWTSWRELAFADSYLPLAGGTLTGKLAFSGADTGISVADTRAVDDVPGEYDTVVRFDLKANATFSSDPAPGDQGFIGLMTFAPWTDASGGPNYQLGFTSHSQRPFLILREGDHSLSALDWTDWREVVLTEPNSTAVRFYDGGKIDYAEFSHDGTDFNTAFVNTTDWNLTSLVNLKLFDGARLTIYDATDTDSGAFYHDGTDFNTQFTSTADWNITGLGGAFSVASNAVVLDPNSGRIDLIGVSTGNANYGWLAIYQSDGSTRDGYVGIASASSRDMYLASDAGEVRIFRSGGNLSMLTQQHDGTGNTTGVQVTAHNGVARDVGMNDLATITENASVTLGAQHCGGMIEKSNTTAYTLTLSASTDLDFPVGGVVMVVNANSTGNITINEGTSTTLYLLNGTALVDTAGGCTLGPGGVATIHRKSSTVFYIWGVGIMP